MDKEATRTAAHQLGVMLTEGSADFYDVVEALSAGYAEGRGETGKRVLLARIAALNELQSVASNTITEYVQAARADAVSWTLIGDALDVSKQAAQQRFGSS